jgi:hypothetical protein
MERLAAGAGRNLKAGDTRKRVPGWPSKDRAATSTLAVTAAR